MAVYKLLHLNFNYLCFIYYLLRDETNLPIINFVVFDDFGDAVICPEEKGRR